MSLLSFLADPAPASGSNSPASASIRRPARPPPDAPTRPALNRPAGHDVAVETRRTEDALTFSVIAKILLPKNSVDRIDLLFKKLIGGTTTFQTLSKIICDIVQDYPAVLHCWSTILGRASPRPSPLVTHTSEVIRWFTSNGYSPLACMNFFRFLIEVRQSNLSKISTFTRILHLHNQSATAIASLMRFASDILPLFPPSARPPCETSLAAPMPFLPLFEPPSDPSQFEMPSPIVNLSAALRRALRARGPQARPTKNLPKLTPSHCEFFIPIPKRASACLFNFMTTSAPRGSETGSHTVYRHQDAPPPPRDLHGELELLEVLDHDWNAIVGFSEHSRQYNAGVRRAGVVLYGDADWAQIEKCLDVPEIRKTVIARGRAALPTLASDIWDGTSFLMQYVMTQPTNAFLLELLPPPIEAEFRFEFPIGLTREADYLNGLITTNTTALHRNPNVIWFIEAVLPIFGRNLTVFGPKTLAYALGYYARLVKTVFALLEPDLQEAASWDAVLDSAYDRAREKFVLDKRKISRKTLSKILKSIITNRTVLDENADEFAKSLGRLTHCIAEFYPVYAQLNRACTWLRMDPHADFLLKLAVKFGGKPELLPLYRKLITFPAEDVFRFDLDVVLQTISVQPA
jgi:hypothetical protein